MQINLSEILSTEGLKKNMSCSLETKGFKFGADDINIISCEDISLELVNTGKKRAKISCMVNLRLAMNCSRCLKPVELLLELNPVAELDFNECETEGMTEFSDEFPYVEGYDFDVDGFVLDECYVQLPMSVLCRDDCKGLCIKCGKDLNLGPCNCDTFIPDPRMAKILDIYNASKEEV